MIHIIFILLMFISSKSYGGELPAQASIQCQGLECSMKFTVKDGWAIYAHDHLNNTLLNIELDKTKSVNIKEIAINWDKQQMKHESLDGIPVNYYLSNSAIPFTIKLNKDGDYILGMILKYAACSDTCSIFTDEIVYQPSNTINNSYSIIYILLIAVLGGFILNFMPCVLPVLCMKIVYLSKNRSKYRIAAIYSGIIVSFLCLALITITMKSLGHAVGWGMHFQEPIFIAFIATITSVAAINMLGLYEFKTPAFLQYSVRHFNDKFIDFFHGVFIVLLATPCTGPFLTTAVAFCLSQNSITILMIYLAIAFGIGLPYLVLLFYPIKIIPKPGPWLENVRLISAIPFLLTGLWLFYVLFKQVPEFYYLVILLFAITMYPIMIFFLKNKRVLIGAISIILFMIIYHNYTNIEQIPWQKFNFDNISNEVEGGKVVIVNITADWCLTCKINEKRILKNKTVINKLQKMGIVMITGDYTKNSDTLIEYIKKHNRSGIPLTVIYGPKMPNGIILPIMFTQGDLFNAIEQVM